MLMLRRHFLFCIRNDKFWYWQNPELSLNFTTKEKFHGPPSSQLKINPTWPCHRSKIISLVRSFDCHTQIYSIRASYFTFFYQMQLNDFYRSSAMSRWSTGNRGALNRIKQDRVCHDIYPRFTLSLIRRHLGISTKFNCLLYQQINQIKDKNFSLQLCNVSYPPRQQNWIMYWLLYHICSPPSLTKDINYENRILLLKTTATRILSNLSNIWKISPNSVWMGPWEFDRESSILKAYLSVNNQSR